MIDSLRLYGRKTTEAADSRQGGAALHAESTGAYWLDAGHRYRSDYEGTDRLSTWREGLLRLLRDALSAGAAGSMETTQTAIHHLEAMETRQVAVPKAMHTGSE
jgi:hypothetical protein